MNLTVTTPCMEKPAAAKPKSDAFEAIYQPVARSPGQCLFASPPGEILGPASPVGSISDRQTFTVTANKGCGVWMMASSLPHVTSNHVSYNGLYGMAVFSQKEGSGEFPGGHGAQESFSEDGDAVLWEAELENDDPLRRPIATALVERNSVSHNGGEHPPTPGLPRDPPAAPATAQPRAWCPARWTSVQSPLLSPPPSPFSCPTFLFSHPHVRNNSDLRALTRCASLPQPRRRLLGGLRPFVSVAASPILTGSELEARNCIPFLLVRPAPWHQSHTWHIHFSEF